MMRKSVGGYSDGAKFSNTAIRTRKVNINPPMYRGGIRF